MIGSSYSSTSDSVNKPQNAKPKNCKENAKRNSPYSHNLKIIHEDIQYAYKKENRSNCSVSPRNSSTYSGHLGAWIKRKLNSFTWNRRVSCCVILLQKEVQRWRNCTVCIQHMAQVRALDWITANSIEKTVEVIGIDIVDMNCIIIVIYRSPKGLLEDFFNCLDCTRILDNIINNGKGIIIMGDININILVKGSDYKQLLDIANIYNLTITIKEPTRVTDSSATGIDQIMTNLPGYQYQAGVKHNLLSDHYAQEMEVYTGLRNYNFFLQQEI
jgi:hypothetical protein